MNRPADYGAWITLLAQAVERGYDSQQLAALIAQRPELQLPHAEDYPYLSTVEDLVNVQAAIGRIEGAVFRGRTRLSFVFHNSDSGLPEKLKYVFMINRLRTVVTPMDSAVSLVGVIWKESIGLEHSEFIHIWSDKIGRVLS